jgi:hypothetical protein
MVRYGTDYTAVHGLRLENNANDNTHFVCLVQALMRYKILQLSNSSFAFQPQVILSAVRLDRRMLIVSRPPEKIRSTATAAKPGNVVESRSERIERNWEVRAAHHLRGFQVLKFS